MVVGEQTWELGGWMRSSTPMPMVSASNFSQLVSYNSEDTMPPKIKSGERLTDEGYITNAPLDLGDDDYVHTMTKWIWVFDPAWRSRCHIKSNSGYRPDGDGYSNLTPIRTRMKNDLIDNNAFKELTYVQETNSGKRVLNDDCKGGNHYWVDKTQGPFTQGCSDSEADNYSEGVDYAEDSLCVYTCKDPNRLVMDNGSCGDCNDGYGLNDDGVCEAGLSTKVFDGLSDLPYGLIGGGIIVLGVGKYLMSRRG